MITDQELIKILNLIRNQPTFVVRESETTELYLESANPLPADAGFYWVAGTTHLQNGIDTPTVFVVDTDSGAEQSNVFWQVAGAWFEHREAAEAAKSLGISRDEMFPYSWTYSVSIEGDIHS